MRFEITEGKETHLAEVADLERENFSQP